jgi:hypothetical protein
MRKPPFPLKKSQFPWKSSLCPLGACLLLALNVQAQDPGLGLWTGVSVEKKFTKNFAVQLNGQTRFTEDISLLGSYLGEVGLQYKLGKNWEVGGFYRYIGRRKWNRELQDWYYRPYHRFYGEISYETKFWKAVKLQYRLRYQHQFRDDAEGVVVTGNYLRNKLELGYANRSRFTPYVSADVFYRVGETVDQVRYRGGVNVRLTKTQSVDLFAFNDTPVGTTDPNEFILGVTYKLRLGYGKPKPGEKKGS